MKTRYVTVIAGVVIKKIKNKDYVLMCQRDEPECPNAHLKWELPGGKVDIGENAVQAVQREIQEETSIRCKAIKLLQYHQHNLWQYEKHQQSALVFAYFCKFTQGKIKNSDKQVKQVKWQLIDKALKLDSLPGIKQMIIEALGEVRVSKNW